MKFVVGENGRNPAKNLPRTRFIHHETHLDLGGGKVVIILATGSKVRGFKPGRGPWICFRA